MTDEPAKKKRTRPEFLDKYLFFHKMQKEGEKRKKEIVEEVRNYLEKHQQPDFKLVPKDNTKVDVEVCVAWAKERLTKEQYDSCFTLAFDPDKFIDLKDVLFNKDKKLAKTFPANGIVKTEWVEVHPVKIPR